jgi:hypothetical protein
MKIRELLKACLTAATIVTSTAVFAADKDAKTDSKTKSYPLDTCVVTDEKLGGHGDPYVFKHEGQEVKLCCKSCLKDFNKDAAKYLKKIEKGAKK